MAARIRSVGKSTGPADEMARRTTEASISEAGHSVFRLPAPQSPTAIDKQLAQVNPQRDEWEAEVVHAQIDHQLDRLRQHIERRDSARQNDTVSLDILDDDFLSGPLRPQSFRTVYADPMYLVRRPPTESEPASASRTSDIRRLIQDFLSTPRPAASPAKADSTQHTSAQSSARLPGTRAAFKVVDIQPDGMGVVTRVLVEVLKPEAEGHRAINATWLCRWKRVSNGPPLLRSIESVEHENVTLKSPGAALFEDVTSSVLGATDAYRDQVLRSIQFWCCRLTRIDDMRLHGHHGLAIGDVNGDGLEDVYVCDAGGLPNRLYVQQPDGTARDFSHESGTDWLESSVSALLIDLDNDGDQDLAVATVAGIVFAANDGKGSFSIRSARPDTPEVHSLCAADFDADGDLDIYACVYGTGGLPGGQSGFEADVPIPYSDANNGGRNMLLKNEGSFRFVDATDASGLDENNHRWSFAAAWEDYDADGDMDLYVANDFGRNNLFQHDGGRFRDVAAELGVEDRAGGMSAAWCDFNRDGRRDLYIGNMFSAAGQRVTRQQRFLDSRPPTEAAEVQRMARGNTLFMANATGRFTDVSQAAAVTMGRWSWGCQPVDFNNDGYEDLVVANGYFTNEKTDDL